MGFDLFMSRRNFNEKCFWWAVRDGDVEEDVEGNELVYKRVPDGSFMAKEVSAETTNKNVLGGVLMIDRTQITLQSPDNLFDLQQGKIKGNCYVKYQDEYWLVTDVQKRKARMQSSEFGRDRNVSHYWYISLRK